MTSYPTLLASGAGERPYMHLQPVPSTAVESYPCAVWQLMPDGTEIHRGSFLCRSTARDMARSLRRRGAVCKVRRTK